MGEYLIIDGYNVINAWKDFAQLRQENLEHARELLVAGVAEYAAFKGYRAVVVLMLRRWQALLLPKKFMALTLYLPMREKQRIPGLSAEPTSLDVYRQRFSLSPVTTRSRLIFWEQVRTAFPPENSASSITRLRRKLPSVCMSPGVL